MRPMPVYPMVQCLDGRHPPFNIEDNPNGCPRHLAATPSTSTETPTPDPHPIDPWTLARVRNTLDVVLARLPEAPASTDDAIAYRDGWLDAMRAIRTEMDHSARLAAETPTRVVGGGLREALDSPSAKLARAIGKVRLGGTRSGHFFDEDGWRFLLEAVKEARAALATTPVPSVSDEGLRADYDAAVGRLLGVAGAIAQHRFEKPDRDDFFDHPYWWPDLDAALADVYKARAALSTSPATTGDSE